MLLLALIIMLCGIRSLASQKFISSGETSDMMQFKPHILLESGRMLQNMIDFYLSES